jgi:hypothetical protein
MKKEEYLKYCDSLKIDVKKIKKQKLIIMVIGFTIGVIYFLLMNDIIVALLLIVASGLVIYILQESVYHKIKNSIKTNEKYFSDLVSFLMVFLDNGFNVFQSLMLCKSYVPTSLELEITTLTDDIQVDKSILPYQKFANKFDSFLVLQISMLLYQLELEGYNNNTLKRFPPLIIKMRENYNTHQLAKRKEAFGIYSILPIVSLILIIVVFTFVIIDQFMGGI